MLELSRSDWSEPTIEFISAFIQSGKKEAAHPDDGWVDRENNKVLLVYPDYNGGLAVGDLLALGDHRKWRTVRVVEIITTMFGQKWYRFTECQEDGRD